MNKIYKMMLVGAMGLLSGCSADLLDIDNPNEVTNTTYWNRYLDALALFPLRLDIGRGLEFFSLD